MRLPPVSIPDRFDHAWQASRDQLARLWAHALLQDELFVQRSNFFLVAESLLVVAYTGILGLSFSVQERPLRLRVAALVLALFGCFSPSFGRSLTLVKGRFFRTCTSERVKPFPNIDAPLKSGSCQEDVSPAPF